MLPMLIYIYIYIYVRVCIECIDCDIIHQIIEISKVLLKSSNIPISLIEQVSYDPNFEYFDYSISYIIHRSRRLFLFCIFYTPWHVDKSITYFMHNWHVRLVRLILFVINLTIIYLISGY